METNNSSQRVTQYLRDIACHAAAGSRLPSVRELMRILQVSPVTVQRALDTLAQAGVIEARPGQGTFVREQRQATRPVADYAWQSLALGSPRAGVGGLSSLLTMPAAHMMALNIGYLPEDSLPDALLAAAAGRALRRPGVWARVPGRRAGSPPRLVRDRNRGRLFSQGGDDLPRNPGRQCRRLPRPGAARRPGAGGKPDL